MRGVHKRDLPEKTCAVCGRPFVWRKKWARDWEHVRYCSDACRRRRGHAAPNAESPAGGPAAKPNARPCGRS